MGFWVNPAFPWLHERLPLPGLFLETMNSQPAEHRVHMQIKQWGFPIPIPSFLLPRSLRLCLITAGPGANQRQPRNPLKLCELAKPKPANSTLPISSWGNHSKDTCPHFPPDPSALWPPSALPHERPPMGGTRTSPWEPWQTTLTMAGISRAVGLTIPEE